MTFRNIGLFYRAPTPSPTRAEGICNHPSLPPHTQHGFDGNRAYERGPSFIYIVILTSNTPTTLEFTQISHQNVLTQSYNKLPIKSISFTLIHRFTTKTPIPLVTYLGQ